MTRTGYDTTCEPGREDSFRLPSDAKHITLPKSALVWLTNENR